MLFSKIVMQFNMVDFLLKNSSFKISQISVQWEQICFMQIDRDRRQKGGTDMMRVLQIF
jgi:hypothetical protein